jgi:hypothetical protein
MTSDVYRGARRDRDGMRLSHDAARTVPSALTAVLADTGRFLYSDGAVQPLDTKSR